MERVQFQQEQVRGRLPTRPVPTDKKCDGQMLAELKDLVQKGLFTQVRPSPAVRDATAR